MTSEFYYDKTLEKYYSGEREVPRVSDILKDLVNYDDINPSVLEYARTRGTAIHHAIFLHNQNDLDISTLDIEIVPYFEGWLKFLSDTGFEVLGFEEPMYSKIYDFAGRPDMWGLLNKQLCVPDIKCTARMEKHFPVQISGYQQLLKENKNVDCKRGALRLLKDGRYRYEPYSRTDDARDFMTFNACKTIHNWRKHNV